MALFIMPFLYAEKQEATVKQIKRWAEYALPGSDNFKSLKPTTVLPDGSKVRTGEGAEVIINVVSGAAMRLDADTQVQFNDMEFEKIDNQVKKRKARISIDKGTASALLKEDAPEQTDFRIETPQGTAAARGTFYGVSVVDGQTFISVKEGKVGVSEKK